MASGLSLYVGATLHRPQHERGPGGMGPSDFGLGTELLDGIEDEAAGVVHGLRRSQTESACILFFSRKGKDVQREGLWVFLGNWQVLFFFSLSIQEHSRAY